MNPEEAEDYFVQSQIHGQVGQAAAASAAAQYYVQEQEKNLADSQLDCAPILIDLMHSLKQDIKKYKDDGSFEWVPTEERYRTLTDLGVDKLLQVAQNYMNKGTLLSNYDDPIIRRRMLQVALALSGLMFMKYELYFRTPTIEEAIEIIKKRIDDRSKIKVFSMEILGLKADEKKIKEDALKEIESRLEEEIEKIRKQKKHQNQTEFELLFVEVTHAIESAHQRAYRGEERGSLRRHTNISEVIGNRPIQKEGGGMFKWIKG